MRRLAEGTPELAAEVRPREMRRTGERGHVERVAIAGVDEVLGAEEVARGRVSCRHSPSIATIGR